MKRMNKIFAAILSVTLLFGATMSANAAEASVLLTVEQSDINKLVLVCVRNFRDCAAFLPETSN